MLEDRTQLPERIEGPAGHPLVGGLEPVRRLEAGKLDEVPAAVGDVAPGRPVARVRPVDDAREPTPGPEHVAGVEVAVHQRGGEGREVALPPFDRRLPQVGPVGAGGRAGRRRVVPAEVRVARGPAADGVDPGRPFGQAVEVGYRDRPAGEEAHEQRRHAVADGPAGHVRRDHLGDGQPVVVREDQRVDLPRRRFRLVLQEARPHVAAQHHAAAVREPQPVDRGRRGPREAAHPLDPCARGRTDPRSNGVRDRRAPQLGREARQGSLVRMAVGRARGHPASATCLGR